MTPERYFIAQAYNNAWANHRLLKACALLSAEDLAAPRQNFFPSIIHTLNHILTVDWLYIGALEGHCPGASAFEPEIPFPAFADLDREQRSRSPPHRPLSQPDGRDALRRAAHPARHACAGGTGRPHPATSLPAPDTSSRAGSCDVIRNGRKAAAAGRILSIRPGRAGASRARSG